MAKNAPTNTPKKRDKNNGISKNAKGMKFLSSSSCVKEIEIQ